MKVHVKTLKGVQFDIEVEPTDTVGSVKKHIETTQGQDIYPCAHQLLVHQGKVLKDETTLVENNIIENNFLVIMVKKPSTQASGVSTSVASTAQAPHVTSVQPNPPAPSPAPAAQQAAAATLSQPTPVTQPRQISREAPQQETTITAPSSDAAGYDQAASNLVAGSNLEQAIQSILDMGGGSWTRDTVVRALRAAYNNPERAVEYLYSGIPQQTEVDAPPVAQTLGSGVPATAAPEPPQATIPSAGPNANPLDLFPQGLPNTGAAGAGAGVGAGNLDFLRNNPQFQAIRALVQANPQVLQTMLQELGRQNPQLVRLIQENQADFLRLINEPVEGGDGDLLGQLGGGMPQSVSVTPEEREAIERLEAMGFDRTIVLEVFFACNKNEQLAANYLLDHYNEFEE